MDSDFSAIRESLRESPEVGETPKKVCVVCQEPADKSCGACNGVDYCSAEHQKSHWKVHKKDCPPIRIANSPEIGPHFVATRDLPPWTLLLTEHPVLVNPFVIYKNDPASCISCRSFLLSAPLPCYICSAPYFCNLACSMNKIHEFECEILSKCNEEQREKLYKKPNLMYLRALHLKNRDPETWAKVLELRGGNQYKPEDAGENDKWFIREILPLLGKKGEGFEADMAKLKGILLRRGIRVQSSLIPLKQGHNTHGDTQLIYLKESNFVDHCIPNCTLKLEKEPPFQLEIRTTVGVKKGSITSIDCGGMSSLLFGFGAMARQHGLHYLKRALCICSRCSDPTGTELGTMLSAVKCTQPNCKDGYLLPVDVKDMAENAPWRCNRTECKGKGSTWAEINGITEELKNGIKVILEKVPMGDDKRIKKCLDNLKKKLHPNHYFVLQLESGLASDLNYQIIVKDAIFSLPRMDLHITMLEHLLGMIEIMVPGLNMARADILQQLFNGINHRVSWDLQVRYLRADQRQLSERGIQVVDMLMPVSKCYPGFHTPGDVEHIMEKREMFQMVLNSIN